MSARRSLAGSALLLGLGMAGAQGLMWVAMPVWSRQFGATDFAVLGVWAALGGVVSVLVSLRYETVLMLPESEQQAAALYRLALKAILVIGAGLTLLALGAVQLLPHIWLAAIGLEPLGLYLPLAVLSGVCSAWMGLNLAWLNRGQAYGAINAARLGQAVLTVAAASLSGMSGWAPGLWLAHGLGALAGALIAAMPVQAAMARIGAACDDWRAVAHRHRDAPLFLWPSALMDTFTQQLPFVLAVSWFGSQAAGQFTLAWRSLALPLFMVSGALGAVFYQRFARLVDQRDAARALLLRVWGLGFAAWLALSLALWFGAETVFVTLFGAEWREAGAMAAVMTPMVAAMAVSAATSGSLLALGGHRFVPAFGVAMLLGRPLAFWWASTRGDLLLALGAWAALELSLIVLYNALIWRRLRVY
ncbi:MAG: hypothetical protein IV092_11835 [Burkholderiaceae bacterium]|nr:hypothetical protein [Burkholderiaceae bacterium]